MGWKYFCGGMLIHSIFSFTFSFIFPADVKKKSKFHVYLLKYSCSLSVFQLVLRRSGKLPSIRSKGNWLLSLFLLILLLELTWAYAAMIDDTLIRLMQIIIREIPCWNRTTDMFVCVRLCRLMDCIKQYFILFLYFFWFAIKLLWMWIDREKRKNWIELIVIVILIWKLSM